MKKSINPLPSGLLTLIIWTHFLISFSCNLNQQSNQVAVDKPQVNTQDSFFINHKGDTILYGVSLPIKGKLIPKDSLLDPEVYKLNYQKILPDPPNHPNVVLEKLDIPLHDNIVTTGSKVEFTITKRKADSSALAYLQNFSRDTLEVIKTVIPSIHPKVIPAQRFKKIKESIYDIQVLGEEEELPINIMTLHQDQLGNIWMASSMGIIRYDGAFLFLYTTEEGLEPNDIRRIFEDGEGNLYFFGANGIDKYDGHFFTHFKIADIHGFKREFNFNRIHNNYPWSLDNGKGFNILFHGIDGGLVYFDGQHFTKYPVLKDLPATKIMDRRGNFWFGSSNKEITYFDGEIYTTYHINTSDEGISPFFCDRKGNTWAFSYQRYYFRINKEGITEFSLDFEKKGWSERWPTKTLEDRYGNLWIGTRNNGLIKLESEQIMRNPATFKKYTSNQGLASYNIQSLIENEDGSIWIGLGLVHKINDRGFTLLKDDQGYTVNRFKGVVEDNDGNLVFLDRTNGLLTYDRKKLTSAVKWEAPNWCLTKDNLGHLWVGTGGAGILHFQSIESNQNRYEWFREPMGVVGNNVTGILMDKQKNIWFSGVKATRPSEGDHRRFGLSRYDPIENSFHHFTEEEGILNSVVTSFFEDSRGHFWMGYNDGSISRFEPDSLEPGVLKNHTISGKIIHYLGGQLSPTASNPNPPNPILTIFEDSRGRMWFGSVSEIGILLYDEDKQFSTFNEDQGLINNSIMAGFLEDDKGNIWVGCSRGLSVFTPTDEVEGSVSIGNNLFKLNNFFKSEGLYPIGLNNINIDSKNQLWVGTGTGIMSLDLNKFELPTAAPKNMQLTQLNVENQYVNFQRLFDTTYQNTFAFGDVLSTAFDSLTSLYGLPVNLNLPHRYNHLTFHFSAIDWAAPQKLRYSYMLEGFDKDWSEPEAINKVDYRNLPPGKLTFKVKAIGAPQKWSETFEYPFTVLPPWWLSTWAYIGYGLILLGVIWGIVRWRLYYIRLHYERKLAFAEASAANEANEAKSLFLSTVSHELRTPLTSIIGFTKLNKRNLEKKLMSQIAPDDVKTQKVAKKISGNLDIIESEGLRLTALLNDLLDLAKIESGKVDWKMAPLNPAELIERATLATSSLFEQKQNLKLIKDIPEDLPTITADQDRILQVLINLISNAYKFTDTGYVKIGIRKEYGTRNSELLFFVKDTGSGIPPSHIDKVFERFKQVEDNQSGKPKGTGLGLPICKEIVEHHGGKIWAKSIHEAQSSDGLSLEKGSTFMFTLPY